MLSRRLESGLSTDELRIILCRVTMRNTRFTWGQDKGRAVLGLLCLRCEFLAKSQPGPPPSGPLLHVYLPQVLTD